MKIYHVEFAKTGEGVSGGEIWMLEAIKFFQAKGLYNILLTTDNGKKTYQDAGLVPGATLEYQTIDSYKGEKQFPIFISYITRTFQAVKLVKKLSLDQDCVVFCHSDFFPNTIPTYMLYRRNRLKKFIYLFHMLAPALFRGYEGHFTGKFQLPRFNIAHYRLNQWLYYRLMPKKATIITNNAYYSDEIHKRRPNSNVHVLKRFAGAYEYQSKPPKKYDLIWIGRFHAQKGLLEIPPIIQIIKQHIPNIKMVVLGEGSKTLTEQFTQEVKRRDLHNNIEMKGFVLGKEKYKYVCQSKLFLMTSFYESFGIVNLEALKNSVPVVAYDMPVYSAFTQGMTKVPMLDRQAMAAKVIELLTNPDSYKAASSDAYNFGKNFSWTHTGQEIYQLL